MTKILNSLSEDEYVLILDTKKTAWSNSTMTPSARSVAAWRQDPNRAPATSKTNDCVDATRFSADRKKFEASTIAAGAHRQAKKDNH